MSIEKQVKKMIECSGKTYQELADMNDISRQAYHQRLFNRIISLKKLINVTQDTGFKLLAQSPKKDITIEFTKEDYKE